MENYKKKAIELIMGLAVNEKKDPSVIPYIPAKVSVSEKEKPSLKRRIGGRGHKYARVLSELLCELEGERRANIHSLMIVKDGEVICEVSHPGYDTNIFHLAHSMSKTVTGIAIGILIDSKLLALDDRVVDIFPEAEYKDPRFADMTVEHLLTMQSGVPFAEAGVVTSNQWTDEFFDTELKYAPGAVFEYNSMNSYILGQIVSRVSKTRLSDLVNEKIFSPLGINNFLWENGPEGHEKGGFGLYLSCESFAKIGLMLLDGGSFDGVQIISEAYVNLMTSMHICSESSKGGFDYGYHVWTEKNSDSFLLNGMLGQNVYVSRELNVVVSINAGNNELFQDSPALEIIRKYIPLLNGGSDSSRAEFCAFKRESKNFFEKRHWIRPMKKERSLASFLGLKSSEPWDESWDEILGTYAFPDNNTGILPIFVRVFQNNYMGGIESISLERRANHLIFKSVEGGIAYEIPLGFYGFCESVLNFRGEKYIVRAIAEAIEDEDRFPIYKIELIFPELPSVRMIKITHAPEGIRVRMSETPNQNVANKFISSFLEEGNLGFALGLIEKKVGEDFITNKLKAVFNPEIYGIDTSVSGYEGIISGVNEELFAKRENDNKFVKTIVGKFIGAEPDERLKPEKQHSGGFLAKALSSLFSKIKITPEENAKGNPLVSSAEEDETS